MQALLLGFLGIAAVLWLSVFGYLLVLASLAVRRRAAPPADRTLPALAVVVPTRDEAQLIDAKLDDLRRTNYPAERMRVLIVDGGSTDATVERVEAACRSDRRLQLVRVAGARGKVDQLNAVLPTLSEGIIVVTDVDAALDPDCIRRLVDLLADDPQTAVAGACIRPATRLLEERMHWWLLNRLWWLEGEALGAAAVAGVCYALRRSAMIALPPDCTAEDIALTQAACARGDRVRLCRRALATELRVPQTAREFLRFRRRRGGGYLRELLRARPAGAARRWRVVRALRLFHFLVAPPLVALAAAAGLALCATPLWPWPVGVAVAFAVPALLALAASTTLAADGPRWWHLGFAAGRLAGLTWLSLLRSARLELPPIGD